jgi:hypothetical protein
LHLRQFKKFYMQKNSPQFWWLIITIYCVIDTLFRGWQHRLYWVYLDLGPFFVMMFGLFLGRYLALKIDINLLTRAMILILLLLCLKTFFIWLLSIQLLADGPGFFIGAFGSVPGYLPRILLRGENPFLISISLLLATICIVCNLSRFKAVVLTFGFLISLGLIVLTGARSLAIAVLMGVLIIGLLSQQRSLKKWIYLIVPISLIFSAMIFTKRDMLQKNTVDVALATSSVGVEQLIRIGIPTFNSQSVGLRFVENFDVMAKVGSHWLVGIGFGSSYYTPGMDLPIAMEGNYVHSQLFWLYLKGGLLLAIFFYGFVSYFLLRLYRKLNPPPSNAAIMSGAVIVIALCVMDLMSNQFATLAGSFYLGFWLSYTYGVFDDYLFKCKLVKNSSEGLNP